MNAEMNAKMNACFVDFDYPTGCSTWSVFDVVARIANATKTCIDSNDAVSLASCDIVLGVPDGTYHSFEYGPTYNASGIGAILATPGAAHGNGWYFLNPFSWTVWVVFVACAIASFCTQLLVRWLDFRRKKTSPNFVIDEDEEHAGDAVLTAFTAMIGTTRLYRRYDGPYFRHVSSMVAALFSVFFVSLYSSNLTAFFFPGSRATLVPDTTFFVARDVFRTVQLPLKSTEIVIRSLTTMSLPTPRHALVAPTVWLASLCSRFAFIPLDGFVTYSVLFNSSNSTTVSRGIADALATEIWPGPSCFSNKMTSTSRLELVDVWGLFALAGVLYVCVLVIRFLKRDARFVWFVRKTPDVTVGDDTLATQVSIRPCRKSEDIDMFETAFASSALTASALFRRASVSERTSLDADLEIVPTRSCSLGTPRDRTTR